MKRKNIIGMILIMPLIASCQKEANQTTNSDIRSSTFPSQNSKSSGNYSEREYTSDELCSINHYSYIPGQCPITDVREYTMLWMPKIYTETFPRKDDLNFRISVTYFAEEKCMDPSLLYNSSPLVFQYSFADEAYGKEVKQGKPFCIQPMTKEFVDDHFDFGYSGECPIPSSCYAIKAKIPVADFLSEMKDSHYVNISLFPNAKADGYQYDANKNRREYLEFDEFARGFWSFEVTVSETEIKLVNVAYPDSNIMF